ncbi:MAG: calcium/sodium antiporter [Desulfovibrionaceae bacterium]
MLTLLLLTGGAAALTLGASLLVKGASRLALALGIPPLLVGLTVVACGTSAPELFVSVTGALTGNAAIALGNVVGSNIFNILLILGLSALAAPLAVSVDLVRRDIPVMIGLSGLVWAFAANGTVGKLEGFFLVLCLIAYLATLAGKGGEARNGSTPADAPGGQPPRATRADVARACAEVAAGLALLVFGSQWFIDGAVTVARQLGMDDLMVGLTLVAGGTSLPELATSVAASMKGERDIAVGNVVGSNIFNLLAVLGVTTLFTPAGVAVAAQTVAFDMAVMTGVAITCLPMCVSGARVSRGEGGVLVAYYMGYVVVLYLHAVGSPLAPALGKAVAYGLIPAVALVLCLPLARGAGGAAIARHAMRGARRLVVLGVGGAVLAAGVVMIVTPGPAVVFIPLGLSILATEFGWARRLLAVARDRLRPPRS